jgi:hypothetical protein
MPPFAPHAPAPDFPTLDTPTITDVSAAFELPLAHDDDGYIAKDRSIVQCNLYASKAI